MAQSFLLLEIHNSGLNARIVEQSYKQTAIKDECYLQYQDLQGLEEGQDPFEFSLQYLNQQLKFSNCSGAVVLVSSQLVSFRNIDVPFKSEKKVRQILPMQMEILLPDSTQNYISDFHYLDISDDSNAILTASIPEVLIDKIFQKLKLFGIQPQMITASGYAEAIGFLKDRKNTSSFVFMNIAHDEMTLVLAKDRIPSVVRSFSIKGLSSENLAKITMQTILGFNQRTGKKFFFDIFISTTEDNQKTGELYDALESTLAFQSGLRSVDQGVQNAVIQEKIDADSLLHYIFLEKKKKYLFNFCSGKYGSRSFFKTYMMNIAASIVLLLSVFGLSMMSIGIENSKIEREIEKIDTSAKQIFLKTFPDKTKVHDPYLQMEANVKQIMKSSNSSKDDNGLLDSKEIKLISIISELSQKIRLPIDIEISRFLFNNGRLVLSGSTDNFNNVDNIKSKIESSQMFNRVSISSAAADKKGDRVNFKFIIEI